MQPQINHPVGHKREQNSFSAKKSSSVPNVHDLVNSMDPHLEVGMNEENMK